MPGSDTAANRFKLISDIAIELHSSSDLDTALNRSIEAILETMKAQQCYLYTRPRGSDKIILEAASPGFRDLIGIIGYEKDETALTATIFADGKGRIVHVPNAPVQHPVWKGKYLKEFTDRCHEEPKSIIGAPLIYKGETVGVITVTNRTEGADSPYFSQDDLTFLEILAKHIATAVESARAQAETELHNKILGLMPDLDFNSALETIQKGITDILKCDSGIIFAVDKESKLIRSIASIGFDKEIAGRLTFPLSEEDALIAKVVKSREPAFVVIKDVRELSKSDRRNLVALGIKGPIIVYPLVIEGEVIGVLGVYSKSGGRPLNEYDIEIIRPYANHAALAIRAAQDRQRIKADSKELQHLNNIIRYITDATDHDELISGVVTRAKEVLRSDFCGILLAPPDEKGQMSMLPGETFHLIASEGLNTPRIGKKAACQLGEGPIGDAIHKGELANLDITNAGEVLHDCIAALKTGPNGDLVSLLACPLKNRYSMPIGALVFIRKRSSRTDGRIFTHRDEDIAGTIASELSIALWNQDLQKYLHDEVKRETKLITSIYDALGCGLSVVEKVDKDDGTFELRIRYMNDRQKEVFGDLTNQICHEAYNGYEKPCIWCPVLRTLEDGKVHMSITYSPVKDKPSPVQPEGHEPAREWRRYLVVASPYEVENGKVKAVLETIVDLTERELYFDAAMDLHGHMINATNALDVAENAVEFAADLMKWDIGLIFLRDKENPSLLKLKYEKGLGLKKEDVGNISYKMAYYPPDMLQASRLVHEIDNDKEWWDSEKGIYPQHIQEKLEGIKKAFIFPLISPKSGEMGVLKGYSRSISSPTDDEFEFEYSNIVVHIAKCAAMTCERLRKQVEMVEAAMHGGSERSG